MGPQGEQLCPVGRLFSCDISRELVITQPLCSARQFVKLFVIRALCEPLAALGIKRTELPWPTYVDEGPTASKG